ncbi:SiaB family protein kinase [Marinoscillum sp. MHG1-6]|uniref:SiaB family protein kinase n=1 Tax=Marinoscillum sp. MHG1-6 TaxID=2959627 RepID=UPI00215781FA|nr:SiaB family protein kinase [Marinoscillum sp. MHG1-6]
MRLNLRDSNLLLIHKGIITPDLINMIIESLEHSVTNLEKDRKVRRKLTNVFIEIFQNVGYHGVKHPDFMNSDMVIVIKRPEYYKIGSNNIIEKSKVEGLKSILDKINGMDAEELREYYKHCLENKDFSEKGTAGLGFIDVARKTTQKLYYDFEDLDADHAYFYFETRVLTDYSTEEKTKEKKIAQGE